MAEKELTEDEKKELATKANAEFNQSRMDRINAIADGNDEGRAADFEDESERTERLAREADEAAARALQQEGADDKQQSEPEDDDTKEVNGETYYRQIVNGAEKWQTLKEIRQNAQKVESADELLRQAQESVRNASRLALSPQKDVPGRLDQGELEKVLAQVALGDEEAIKRLASAIAAPSSPSEDVLQAIDRRLSFRTELATLEAEQKELLEDPYLAKLFRASLDELKQKDPNTPLATAYRTIGKDLREHFGGMLKNSAAEKLERKRKLPQVPNAATRQQVSLEETGEEDPSVTIAEMAKKRGFVPHVYPGNSAGKS